MLGANDSANMIDSCLLRSGDIYGAYRPLVTGSILFFSIIAILTNLSLLFVFVLQWKASFHSQHFTYFVINMIMAGLLFMANNLWIAVPCALNKCEFVRTDLLMVVLATPNTIAYFSYLLSEMSFTIYRFTVFMSTNFAESIVWIKCLLMSPWLITLTVTFVTTVMGCLKRYNRYSLSYTYRCSHCEILFGFTFIDLNFYAGQIIPLLMLSAHVFILASVYRRRQHGAIFQQRQLLVDARLAIQLIIVCVSQNVSALLFFLVPKMSHEAVWGIVALNIIDPINVTVNPVVQILFNQQVRRGIRSILYRGKSTVPATQANVTRLSHKL